MTTGYHKNGKNLKTCIMSSHSGPRKAIALGRDFEKIPKLITHNSIKYTGGTRPLSGISDRPLSMHGINVKEFILNKWSDSSDPFIYKYIASLVAKYHITNKLILWDYICNSGIFDIWMPEAPFNNIYGKKDPLIQGHQIRS